MDTWEKDGVRHQKLKVRALTIKFLAPRGEQRQQAAYAQRQEAAPAAPAPASGLESDPEDLPF